MRRVAITGVLFLAGCYVAHERDAGRSPDAPVHAADDGLARIDTGVCPMRPPATVHFEPPLPMGVRGARILLLGIEADAAANGVRLYLDTCGGAPSCTVTMIVSNVGNPLAGVRVPNSAVGGTLSVDDAMTTAFVSVSDRRRCAECGGDLRLLAGRLIVGFDPELIFGTDTVLCSHGCEDDFVTVITSGSAVVHAAANMPADSPPLHARLASDFENSCARCDCATPDIPATGIVFTSTGIFAP